MGRVCKECGCDTWKSSNYERIEDRLRFITHQRDKLARENGLLTFKNQIAEEDKKIEKAGLQRKIVKQSRVIRKLENKIRKLGKFPHEDASLKETSPVSQEEPPGEKYVK